MGHGTACGCDLSKIGCKYDDKLGISSAMQSVV